MTTKQLTLSAAFLAGTKSIIGEREKGFFSRWGWNTGTTYSGETVSQDRALQNDTVWSCVRLVAESVSSLPLVLYRRRGEAREPASDHALYSILHSQPNARMSAVTFWQAIAASMLLWGNGYAEITRRADGSIISLEFLLPSCMRLSWDFDGVLQYAYAPPSGGPERKLRRDDVLHIKAFTLDGEVGISAIQYGRHSIGSALAADRAADEVFKNASRATGILSVDVPTLKPEQRQQLREHAAQVSRQGGIYVFEKGAEFHRIGFNPHDAELLATRSFSVETICRWFRVPPVMIGHGDKQSSWPTSTEAQGQLFLRYVLRSFILAIEQEIRRALLSPIERGRYFAEFSLEGLLRGDSAARASFYASALQNGWMTRNEVRRLENLPPAAGGDLLTVQSAMIPLSGLGSGQTLDASARSALLRWLNIDEAPQQERTTAEQTP